jgi:hypothetical protein
MPLDSFNIIESTLREGEQSVGWVHLLPQRGQ